MKANIYTVMGLILINFIIVAYEKGLTNFATWKLYFAVAVLLLLGSMFPLFIVLVLIPVTLVNLLTNTKRFQAKIKGDK